MHSVLRSVKKRKKSRRLGEVEIISREEYGELELDAKVETIRALVPLGLMHVAEVLDDEVTGLAGEHYARKAATTRGRRHGSNPGTVGLAGQRVAVRVPRVRSVTGGEISLRSYEALSGDREVNDLLLKRVLYGISCRNYEAAAELIPGAIGLSSSTVSRGFIQASAAKLRELQERDLSGEDVVALFLDGKTFADATLLGGAGDDFLQGGVGDDSLHGGAGDDTFVGGSGNDTMMGGAGFDTILIEGTPGDDTITVVQDSATKLTYTVNTVTEVDTMSEVEEGRIEALAGDDVIGVSVDDLLVASPMDSLRFSVIGDAPNASDRLVVRDDDLGDLVIHREGTDGRSGSVTVGPLAPVDYQGIESVSITPFNSITGATGVDELGRLIVFKPDPFDNNDGRLIATFLGQEPTFHRDLTIDPGPDVLPPPFGNVPGDEDWFEFRPNKIGMFRFETLFQEIDTLANGRAGLPNSGDLDISVYDSAGVFIADSTSTSDDESVDISMAADTSYFLRVVGAVDAINVYDLVVTEVDLVGAMINDVSITGVAYDLFDPKPSEDGPTPPITSLTISLEDTPPRAPGDLYPALDQSVAENPGHYLLIGDHNGVIPISDIIVTNAVPLVGSTATATIELQFSPPLPDDRFTLRLSDAILDPAGNELDGETNTIEPHENPLLPSGDGIAGGDFVARFTVDTRAELGVWASGSVYVDTNGNFAVRSREPGLRPTGTSPTRSASPPTASSPGTLCLTVLTSRPATMPMASTS